MTFDPTNKERMKMTNSETIYRYIHAGKGEVTLVAPTTLKAHSYSFECPANANSFLRTQYLYMFCTMVTRCISVCLTVLDSD